jgi:hypothetical protein
MSEPPEKSSPSSRSSVSSTPPSLGGSSSARPPARSTERTYESGIRAAGSVQTPQVASSAYAVIPMIGRMLRRFSPIVLVLVAVACGSGGGTKTVTVTQTRTVEKAYVSVPFRNYFLLHGKVQPVERGTSVGIGTGTGGIAEAAAYQLGKSTTTQEERIGITDEAAGTRNVHLLHDVVVATASAQPRAGLAQIVYTLSQFPGVKAVEINGKRYTRADFEDETPIILVESPLPFQTVHSPLRVTGTANTFEATFNYDLIGPDGKVIAQHFVTATSGSGTRGTFDFTVPFTVAQVGSGKLVVYELSAKDGSRVHQVEIPLQLEP